MKCWSREFEIFEVLIGFWQGWLQLLQTWTFPRKSNFVTTAHVCMYGLRGDEYDEYLLKLEGI
jgi:hypothetical protein